MADESPQQPYERLQRKIQSEILKEYPNPTRKGCPGDTAVKAVAARKEVVADELWEHITHCSPCYAEFLAYRETSREANKNRARKIRYRMAATAAILIVLGGIPFLLKQYGANAVHNVEFDLRHTLSFRGADPETTKLDPALTLERGRTRLTIDLPETWLPGKYDVTLLDQGGRQVYSSTGTATAQDGSAVLIVDGMIDADPGDYVMSLRRENSAWKGYPVRVTGTRLHF